MVEFSRRTREQLIELFSNVDWQHELQDAVEDESKMQRVRDSLVRMLTVFFQDCSLASLASVAQTLSHISTIQKLDFDSNQISDISRLAEALRYKSTLLGLSLCGNQISDISSLSEPLRENSTL